MSKSIFLFHILIITQIVLSFSYPCKEGSKNCEKCNPVTKLCVKCDKNIYALNSDGECEPKRRCQNNINYCIQCTEEGNMCLECEAGLFPDENGACSYSYNCEISYKGKCLKCKDNFILNEGIGVCKSLYSEDFKNCKKINKTSGYCQECEEGYNLNMIDRRCTQVKNCSESSYGICTKCVSGFYLDKRNNQCKEQKHSFIHCKQSVDGVSCDMCDDDFFFNDEGHCVNTTFCLQSDSQGNCEKCAQNYYFSKDKICTTSKHCEKGRGDIGVCISCEKNYVIDFSEGICKLNDQDNDLKYCEVADGVCQKCRAGYELGNDNKCSDTTNCDMSEFGLCQKCADDYYLGVDKKCTDVDKCTRSLEYECIECEDNYYYNRDNKTCFLSEGIYENCLYGITGFCLRCIDNFYLNRSDHLCYSNLQKNNFYKCSLTDYGGENCFACEDDYYLGMKDNKCSRANDCDVTEDENRCLECRENYCLNVKTGLCVFNYEVTEEDKKYYFKCKRTNKDGNKCEICVDGYTLNEDGLCVK